MKKVRVSHRLRRTIAFLTLLAGISGWLIINPASYEATVEPTPDPVTVLGAQSSNNDSDSPTALEVLAQLEIKGRAPKTGYARTEFYNNWPTIDGCNLRQRIIKRDFGDTAVMDSKDSCKVIAGSYAEPYTGEYQTFATVTEIGKGVQIDHVVALSDAWQKGAQYQTKEERYQLATDPLNLIAVDSSANQSKSDGDAATWLPKNKAFRCQYVARQVSVKYKYHLWVSQAEHDAIKKILETCPAERAISVSLPSSD